MRVVLRVRVEPLALGRRPEVHPLAPEQLGEEVVRAVEVGVRWAHRKDRKYREIWSGLEVILLLPDF